MTGRDYSAFHGIYPSTLCPMRADFSVDERALAAHVADVMSASGLTGILCNGHAGENFLLTRAEQRRVVEVSREVLAGRGLVVAGINSENSLEAAACARDAQAAGADAVMVFPPYSWALSQDATMAVNHHRFVCEATDLPLMLFQGSVRSGTTAYRPEVLARLVKLPNVVAIKEGSWESSAYEANRRLVHEVAPEVAVMASGDEHLLSCFVSGSEGSVVSLAVLIPEAIVALDAAVRRGDMAAARNAHETVYPLARSIYGTVPGGHAAARLKTCLKLLGRLSCDAVRPPIGRLEESEVAMLRAALQAAHLI